MEKEQRQTNEEYAAKNKWFKTICAEMCVEPTSRQASKFRNQRGIAYRLAENKG